MQAQKNGHTILVGWRMRPLSVGLQWVIRLSWLGQLALGLAFWTGNLLALVPVHMLNGLLFSLLFEAQAGLAAWAGVSWRLVLLSVAWGLLVPGLGVTQTALLPGDLHWLVRPHEPVVVDPHAVDRAPDESRLEAETNALDLG